VKEEPSGKREKKKNLAREKRPPGRGDSGLFTSLLQRGKKKEKKLVSTFAAAKGPRRRNLLRGKREPNQGLP